MMTRRFLVSIAIGTALAAAPAVAALASPATAVQGTTAMHSCAVPAHNDQARCFAVWSPQTAVNATLAAGRPAAPAGLGARQIENAYRLSSGRNPHATVAVVEAYDTPGLPADLSTYRSHYGLGTCAQGDGCLRVVNQNGQTSPLPPNGYGSGWDVEATLDVDMVSTACPKCKILVVEANSPSVSDLATAERAAARLGAVAISNSYGARENGLTQAFSSAYNLKGHTIVASSGDLGYTAANWPANLATVTAAGGTVLTKAANARGWTEKAWDTPGIGAGGSGCSAYVAKPAWQRALRHDTDCPRRTVADVSAVAWNVAIYDQLFGGWLEIGGTSVSSPLIAGVYALAGNAATATPAYPYAHASRLFDITAGTNDYWGNGTGSTCAKDYLCVAKPGYDAPTGLGTPNGVTGF